MRQDVPIRHMLAMRCAAERIPVTGGFELTPRCNLNCKMCYIHMSPQESAERGREHTAQEWIDLGKQAVEAGTLFLLLSGGEPFLRPDFREIYLSLTKLGLSVSINSNGTLIDDEAVEWLKQSPPAQINISLYGASRETYAALCGDPMGYDRAVHAIDALQKAGILVSINATMTPINDRDMESIAAFGKERGLQVKSTYYLFPPERREPGSPRPLRRYDPETMGRLSAKAQWLTEDQQRLRAFAQQQADGENFEKLDDCVFSKDAAMGCLAGSSQFWVTWDGRMTPCGMMNQPCAQPFQTGFREAWKQIAEETSKLRLPPQCKACALRSACLSCAAINYCETGRTDTRPDFLCRLTASYCRTLKELCK